MTLLNGEILWNLLWLLPLCAILFYISYHKRNVLLERFLGKHAKDPAYVSASPVLRFWRAVILTAVIILLLIAAARPSWGHSILPYTGQGRDLMFVFDVSKSMLAQDVRPSRLEHAKWLVRQLAEKNQGDRFGLIAFAGNAFLECPLTIDKTSFLSNVDELSTDSIPLGGTNIQKALSESIHGFRAAESQFRAVVLITDGDELTGDSGKAVQEIIRLRIPLFILGIGDPSQPSIIQLPDGNGGIQILKDKNGNVVNAPLNEKKLAELAAKTGGIYVRSTTTNPGIEPIEARIKKLETREIDSGKQTRPIERPLYPLLAALFLFFLWLVIPERRKKIRRMNMLLFTGLLFLSSDSFAQTSAPVPEKKEKDEIQTRGLSPEEIYNLGLKAQTQEKDAKKAVQLYSKAIDAVNADPEVRARSAQNLGVMNHQMARAMLQQSVQTLQSQQLDPALQLTEKALKQLDKTEEIYKSSLKISADPSAVSRNQHQLLSDRKKAEELKKKIEELKKKQQEARQNTQKAMDQQQKQNQQKKQDKKNQKQDQQSAKDQTQKARESAKQMEKQAKDLNQKQMEDQAKKAGEELEKAQKAQEKNQNKKAEEHLKKALQQLGTEQKKQDQKQNKDGKGEQKKDQNNKGDQQKQDQQLPKQQQGQQAQQAKPEPEKEIDKNQAQALLEMMSGDEKKLKDELKARMKRNYDAQSVEKDW